jgi:Flp pilus assembly protein TadG
MNRLRSPIRLRADESRGQALVEFALVLIVLIPIIFGIVDFGRGVYAYNAISNAAREGVRTAIVNQNVADIRTRSAQQATSLGLTTTPPTTCPSLNLKVDTNGGICVSFVMANDQTQDCSANLAPGCIAIVKITYPFAPITPVISRIIPSLALTSVSEQTIESVCTGAGCPIP